MPNATLRANARTLPTGSNAEPVNSCLRASAAQTAIPPYLRARIERAVERLLATLDAFDALDADREDGHDREVDRADFEPSLGAAHGLDQEAAWFADGLAVLDGEMEVCI